MAKNIVTLKMDGTSYTARPFGTCDTAAGTAAKVVTCADFSLVPGTTILVKFTNANSASSPTLNVNSTGAKSIYYRNAALTSSLYYWGANDIVEFYYDSTNSRWILLNVGNTNTTYSSLKNPSSLTVQGSGTTATTYDGSAAKTLNITGETNITVTASDGNIKIKGPTLPTIPTALKNPKVLTVGSKTYDGSSAVSISASDLGLASALKYCGTTTTNISDGSTTNPVTINSASHTATQGCVVAYGKKEFVWTGSAWEELGNEGNYKVVQDAVADPTASGNSTTFIATISQDSNGKISVTKKNVQFPGDTYKGTVTSVTPGNGLLHGSADSTAITSTGTLNVGAGTGISVSSSAVNLKSAATGEIGGIKVASVGTSTSGANKTVNANKYAVHIDSDGLGYVALPTWSNNAGDITSVVAGNGLTGGATSGDATLNVGAGTGISVAADTVSVSSALYTTASATTAATAGWYRIAASAAGISNCNGIFQIVGTVSGRHTTAIVAAGTSYGVADSSSVSVLHCDQYSTSALSKVRIVYHTTYNSNYAYLEVYNPSATALPITVKMLAGTGWSLVTPSTAAGSVPSGYSNKEVPLNNGILGGHKHSFSGTTGSATQGGTVGSKTAGGTNSNTKAGGTISNTTATGSVSSSFTGTAHNHTFTGTAHKHTFTGSAVTSGGASATESIYQITGVGSLPSLDASYSSGKLTIGLSKGSLPTRSSITVAKAHTHSVTAAGTLDEVAAAGTIANTTAGGSVSSTFTGTAHTHTFTGTDHTHTFTGSAHDHSFTGSSHTHSYSGTTGVPTH